ncbi:MAG: hypothetical protein GXY44_16100 [Phycisphaerales bacterium]|nr:hypothetical protein [Phycisphaerales bacterium]
MKWPTVPITTIAELALDRVTTFDGERPYIDTGSLGLDGSIEDVGSMVTFKTRPSRADLVVRSNDILFARMKGTAKVLLAAPHNSGWIFSTGFAVLRPKPSLVEPRYLYHYVRSSAFQQQKDCLATGAIQLAINNNAIPKVEIPVPAISEQQKIAAVLDQAESLLKKRVIANDKATRIIYALFYKMFGDPVTNPMGWLKRPINKIAIVTTGSTPSRKIEEYYGDYIEWIKSDNINTPSHFLTTATEYLSKKGERIGRTVESGATLITCIAGSPGCIGNAAMTDRRVAFNQQINALTPRDGVNSIFLYCHCLVSKRLIQAASTGGMKGLVSKGRLSAVEFILPPSKLQDHFGRLSEPLIKAAQTRIEHKAILDRLFTILSKQAFSGDLTTKWRVAHMRELLAEMEAQAKALDCPSTQSNSPEVGSKRHAGHDMFNKAALAAYITDRCHAPDRPMGRVKLAKLFYLVQQKAEIELTETFTKRAAGPLDDEIHKFLSLAQKSKWLVLCRGEGDLKPVRPGANVSKAIEQAQKLLGPSKAKVDEMLDQMKGWGYRALERWATVLDASFELTAAGQPATVEGVKDIIQRHPDWVPKLSRDEFSDTNIEAALKGLRGFGFKTNQD